VRELRIAEADMEEGGRTQKSMASGIEAARPCVKRHDVLTDRLVRLFRKFGFTPVDRVGLGRQIDSPEQKPARVAFRQR